MNGQGNDVVDFVAFRKMITPIIMPAFFALSVLLCVVNAIVCIVKGVSHSDGALVLVGVLYLLVGPIVIRVGCETVMVLFRILETLRETKHS